MNWKAFIRLLTGFLHSAVKRHDFKGRRTLMENTTHTNGQTHQTDFSWAQNGKVNEVLFMQEFLRTDMSRQRR